MFEQLLAILSPLLSILSGQYGAIAQVLMFMGSIRLLMKPLMTAIQSYVDSTATTSDNEFLAKVLSHPVYKVLSFLLDLVASVKLPKAAPPTT